MDVSQKRLDILVSPINYIFSFPIMALYLPYNPSELAKSHEIPQNWLATCILTQEDASSLSKALLHASNDGKAQKKQIPHEDQPGKNMKKWRLNMDKHGYHG